MYGYNLLVSFGWRKFYQARKEIRTILSKMGDENTIIKRTIAQGIAGVNTILDPRQVIKNLYSMYNRDPSTFVHTLKWVPVDYWTTSDLESMVRGVLMLRDRIARGEKWMMVVEKRRYTQYHKIEIIKHLAEYIDEKVDLKYPDKIVRVDIIGNNAGISVIKPDEVFSVSKARYEPLVTSIWKD
ncbi:MAG: THUMP domain-containing protein [Nitrososphaerales archaeon]